MSVFGYGQEQLRAATMVEGLRMRIMASLDCDYDEARQVLSEFCEQVVATNFFPLSHYSLAEILEWEREKP